jgi:glucose 1-dehydrogenase
MKTSFRFDGDRVLVTGASSGIGRAVAVAFGGAGARVGVNYRSGAGSAESVAEEVRSAGGEAVTLQGDVSDAASVEGIFQGMRDAFGGVDCVVINAGLQADAAFGEMTFEDWRKVMSVDLDGAFLTARAAVRAFADNPERDDGQGRGRLVFVTSVHETIPWSGHVNYAAAKGGVRQLMRSLAKEVAPTGIRINGVAPGPIHTAINDEVMSDEAGRRATLAQVPMGRLGDAHEIAQACLFLCSDAAAYICGHSLVVDGGMGLYAQIS